MIKLKVGTVNPGSWTLYSLFLSPLPFRFSHLPPVSLFHFSLSYLNDFNRTVTKALMLIHLLFFREGWQGLKGLCWHLLPQWEPLPTPEHHTLPTEPLPNIPFYWPMKLCVWYHGLKEPQSCWELWRSNRFYAGLGHIWTRRWHKEDALASQRIRGRD